MKEALEMVKVSKDITNALVDGTGKYAPVLDFMNAYGDANWSEVSRQLILVNAQDSVIYDAYTGALSWFRDLFYGKEK